MNIPIKNIKVERQIKERSLPIVEVFGNTIQGEGPRLRPAIFIRTGLCNLKCEGFNCTRIAPNGQIIKGCDTIHAVSPKFKETWKEYDNFEDLLERIKPFIKTINNRKQDIIITGGEPTMHWYSKVFQDMLKYFVENGYHVTIETNGSKLINIKEDYQKQIQFSCSVKLAVSGEPKRKRINFEALDELTKNDLYFKFVVSKETFEEDIKEIIEITSNYNKDVYLMPLGETREKQIKQTRFVVEKCAEYNFNFSPRAHILAFDDLDGV